MEFPVEKNKEYVVNIIDNGFQGEGIAKVDGFTVFVQGAIKGEKVRILILKVLSSHAFGKILEILEVSDKRCKIDCRSFNRCGGCSLRHIDYIETLEIKRKNVQSLVDKGLDAKIKVEPTVRNGVARVLQKQSCLSSSEKIKRIRLFLAFLQIEHMKLYLLMSA